jgi:hypothetical protein
MAGDFFDWKPGDVMMVAAHEGDLDAAKAWVSRPPSCIGPLRDTPVRARQRPRPAAEVRLRHERLHKRLASRLGA